MFEYSYLSASNRKQPAHQYQIDGKVLLSGRNEVPLFWYALFSPHETSYPGFDTVEKDDNWFREQPPYLITTKETAVSRLAFRQKNLFRLLGPDQTRVYDQFSEVISRIEMPYIHLYADPVARKHDFGILKKKMLDLLHSFEKLEKKQSRTDLLFSPVSFELGVDPKSFSFSWTRPRYIYRRLQHKYWDRRGMRPYDRETAPLRSEQSFLPPTQFNLVGYGESISVPWE